MLRITVPGQEFYDEEKNEFITTKPITLQLEHSLVSLSKWESKWHKPFLSRDPKTKEETQDYIRCMTVNHDVDPYVYSAITDDMIAKINAYIDDPMTATTFSNMKNETRGRKVVTAEELYYSMIAMDIPFECQKWHLNRLMTLIRVCSIRNAPSKKMGKKEQARMYSSLNASRRAKLGTRG